MIQDAQIPETCLVENRCFKFVSIMVNFELIHRMMEETSIYKVLYVYIFDFILMA